MMYVLALLALALLPVSFWAGHEWGKRRYRAPMRRESHADEYLYLKDGAYVPYDPPKFVPEGMSPVQATWAITRETGIQHHTRRIGE